MRAVGIRELKNKLSQYVRLVEAGESVLVTDRGTIVAEIRPPGPTTQPPEASSAVMELIRSGRASAGLNHDPGLYEPRPRLLSPGAVRTLLDEERGGR